MRVLIVEDDAEELNEVREAFTQDDAVAAVGTLDEAIVSLRSQWPDVIILDAMFPAGASDHQNAYLQYPQFNVRALLDELKELKPANKPLPAVILISGAVEAAKQAETIARWLAEGRIFELLPKGGFASWPLFREALRHKLRAFRHRENWIDAVGHADKAYAEMAGHGIVTQHPAMARVWEVINVHTRPEYHTVPLYLYGESGSGKELFAKAVAMLKGAEPRPYNCNRPGESVIFELFGVGKDAYTKVRERRGLIEIAGDSVLILDQFCSIDVTRQFELLRAIEPETRDFNSAGEPERFKKVKCKFVISDTVAPFDAFQALNDPAAQKRLIHEMYSRFKVPAVRVPPLRERRTDIPHLTKSFLARFNHESGNDVRLDGDVLSRFADGPWAGNVRGLRDVVQVLTMRCHGVVSWEDVCAVVDPAILAEEIGGKVSRVAGDVCWSPESRRPTEKDEDALKQQLRQELPAPKAALVDELARRLETREKNDPGRHLFYAALLFIATNPHRTATASQLQSALCIGSGQANKLCSGLEGELRTGLTDLCKVPDEESRTYLFQMA